MPHLPDVIEVRLVDCDAAQENTNLASVLDDAERVVRQPRADARSALVHCVQARSRTPMLDALYWDAAVLHLRRRHRRTRSRH